MDKKRDAPKEKRRNNEKRKEKSRDAARSRRSKETEIFSDLANTLPITLEQVTQLDKASIMRLAISYLKVRDMVSLVPELKNKRKEENPTDSLKYLKSLEGFILALSPDGDFVYISENVSDYLGISQIDLMGQNVFEYCHPCDHEEIRETLSGKTQGDCIKKSLFLRLKCTLTSKGRSVNLKSATYKIIHCTGHLVKDQKKIEEKDNADKAGLDSCFIALGKPIPHPSNIETPLPKQTFLTKHSMDMKFTHADDDFMTKLLGYEPDDLLGKSVYEYHHAMDMDLIISAYKCLFSKGQCETNRYRFLAKSGGYVWVVTQATLIHDKMQKPQSVVCVNYVLRNHSISPVLQLLLALRFYATGSFLITAGDVIGVSQSAASNIVKRVSFAIARLAQQYVNMPTTEAELLTAKTAFYHKARLPRVIGSLDCTHIKIQSPGGPNAELFRNRKGYFSLNVQTVASTDLKILDIVARWPGSTHDQIIFDNSAVKHRLLNNEFQNSLLVADSGYANSRYVITPLIRPNNRVGELYNESVTRTRNPVERQYGLWKRRFPVLALGLRLKLQTSMTVIIATAVLHNIAIEAKEEEPNQDPELNIEANLYNEDIVLEPPENEFVNARDMLLHDYFPQLLQ